MIIQPRKKPVNRLKPITKGSVEAKATPKKNTKNEPKSSIVSTESSSAHRTGQNSNYSAPSITIQRKKRTNRLTIGQTTANSPHVGANVKNKEKVDIKTVETLDTTLNSMETLNVDSSKETEESINNIIEANTETTEITPL